MFDATAQDYIEAGFYTVPLKGKLIRREDGTKTGAIMPRWSKYNTEFNTKQSDLVAAIPGESSGFCVIDADDSIALQVAKKWFKDANQDYMEIRAIGNKEASSFLFAWNSEVSFNLSGKDDDKLEFFGANRRLIYMPCKGNTTKEVLKSDGTAATREEWLAYINGLPMLSPAILSQIKLLKINRGTGVDEEAVSDKLVASGLIVHSRPDIDSYLECLEKETSADKTERFRRAMQVVAPREYKNLVDFDMDQIPQGEGSNFLMRVMARISVDESVDKATAVRFMLSINERWDHLAKLKEEQGQTISNFDKSMDVSRLRDTILNRHINGEASMDGKSFWVFDPDWKSIQLAFPEGEEHQVFVFFDTSLSNNPYITYSSRAQEYVRNLTAGNCRTLVQNRTKLTAPKADDLSKTACSVSVIKDIFKQEGLSTGEKGKELNIIHKTKALKILQGEAEPTMYKEPDLFIDFMEHLIPDESQREYFLRFIKTKFTTGEMSEVIHLFLGPQGSGKSTIALMFMEILGDHFTAPTSQVMKEKHNQFLEGAAIVNIDEISKADSDKEKLAFYEAIKAYTGKDVLSIRSMATDPYPVKNYLTFLITTNSYEMPLEDDRRHSLYSCPNKLKNASFIHKYQELKHKPVLKALRLNIENICKYIYNLEPLNVKEYTNAPDTLDKRSLAMKYLSKLNRLLLNIENSNHEDLFNLIKEANVISKLKEDFGLNRLPIDSFNALTDESYTQRKWLALLKEKGINTYTDNTIIYVTVDSLFNLASDYDFDETEKVASLDKKSVGF